LLHGHCGYYFFQNRPFSTSQYPEWSVMQAHLRIARPVSHLAHSAAMYVAGLGLVELGRFDDHQGFDGVMLGHPDLPWHLEFTHCRSHPNSTTAPPPQPTPTAEDLLVFYLPDAALWLSACANMVTAGFKKVSSFNPYWAVQGQTFEDPDGYRVVLQNATWQAA
jgi:hypothetical protein